MINKRPACSRSSSTSKAKIRDKATAGDSQIMLPEFNPLVLDFFAPFIQRDQQSITFEFLYLGKAVAREYWQGQLHRVPTGPGVWLAGVVLPAMVRHLFLFHSATEVLCFCQVHSSWLEKPGACAFVAVGLLPEAGHFSDLYSLFPKARLHFAFGNDMLAAILDCKAALWYKGKDAVFSLADDRICWRWDGKAFSLPASGFSFHRFQLACGLRFGFRTHKPPLGNSSFLELLTAYDT